MRLMTRGRLVPATLVLAVLATTIVVARPYVRGLSFVVRAANVQGIVRRFADYDATSVAERELQIPIASATIPGRAYVPQRSAPRAVLLVPGLHPSGIEEVRFVELARQLAASGVTVVAADIPELKQFAIGPAVTDVIEQATAWLAAQSEFAPDGRVGLVGSSFSGGLALVAAGRPTLRDRVAFVASLGGHDDLARVFKYLCTGVEGPPPESASPLTGLMQRRDAAKTAGTAASVATGWAPPPNENGVAIVLLAMAERMVPAAQVDPLRDGVRRFLQASADGEGREEEITTLRALGKAMREPSATLFRYLLDHDIVHLGARLVPNISAVANAPALSPARSAKTAAPVFLLHGTGDDVIPAVEALHLAATLRGTTAPRMLLSRGISRDGFDQSLTNRELASLGSFWADVLKQ